MRDGETLLQPGFYTPEYASPRRYDSQMYKYGDVKTTGVDCTLANGQAATPATCMADAGGTGYHFEFDDNNDCPDEAKGTFAASSWVVGAMSKSVGGVDQKCENKIPQPIFSTLTADGRARPFFEDLHDTAQRTTVRMPGHITTTAAATTTVAYDKDAKLAHNQFGVVINSDLNTGLSPYMHTHRKENKCDGILGRWRRESPKSGFDFFNPGDVDLDMLEVMTCNAVYGWALGGRCASVLDHDNEHVFELEGFVGANDEAKQENLEKFYAWAQKKHADEIGKCSNYTRTECDKNYFGDLGVGTEAVAEDPPKWQSGKRTKAEFSNMKRTLFKPEPFTRTADANNDVGDAVELNEAYYEKFWDAIKDKLCYMKLGYGRSVVNNGRFYGTIPTAKDAENQLYRGPVMPGSDMSPSAYDTYFQSQYDNGAETAGKYNFFQDLSPHGEAPTAGQKSNTNILTKVYTMTTSIDGDPSGQYYSYNPNVNAQLVDTANGPTDYKKKPAGVDTAQFAGVNVPITTVDSRYLYERIVYDFLVLSQMADNIGREQDFINLLPGACFSNSYSDTAHQTLAVFFAVLAVLLVAFCIPRLIPALDDKGYQLFGVLGCVKGNEEQMESIQTKLIFIFALFTGLTGLAVSMLFMPTPPETLSTDQGMANTWGAVLVPSVFGNDGSLGSDANGNHARIFLYDILNGDFTHAFGLTSKMQTNAYYLSVMSVVIVVLSILLFLFKPMKDGKYGLGTASKLGTWA